MKTREHLRNGWLAPTHGMTNSPEYMSWLAMKKRCLNPKQKCFRYYGGKGVKIFPLWISSFEAFLAYMGPKPTPKHSIDRYPNQNGNYEPGNVRWATQTQQIRNSSKAKLNESKVGDIRRLVLAGNFSFREIGRMFGVSHKCISSVAHGKTWKSAFTILELLAVISIMALIAALGIPAIKAINISQMRYTVTPAALVQEINLARQKAISTRLDTYVLFDLYTFDSNFTNAGIVYTTNIQPCQSWCIVQYGRCGDQIGHHSWHQCSNWQSLPSGIFINPFALLDNQTPYQIAAWSKDYAKPLNSLMPLPHVTIGFESLPCLAFKGGSGALMSDCPEYIVLMTGQHYWQPDAQSTNSAYTVIEIDMAGRAEIEQRKAR